MSKKQTEVILTEPILSLGASEGDTVSVAPGFARNYLLPLGKAIPNSANNQRRIATLQATRDKREARDLQHMSELHEGLQSLRLVITAKTGEGGKMFGVLLCQNENGDTGYIKAFSGLFNRISHVRGWAPPVSDLCDTAAHQEKVEHQVGLLTNEVDNLNDALATLRNQQESITCTFEPLIDEQMHQNRRRRAKRKQQRELITDHDRPQRLNQLSHESQEDQDALRAIRSAHREAIHPITEKVTALEEQLLQLKRSRRDVSAQLNHTLQSACVLNNFTGTAKPLMEVFLNKGVPTGAGDCCAPKLLHYAATHGLTPLGLAEFWLGAPKSQGRVDGHFYPACEEKCTPLLGFMLCGLPTAEASS